MNIFEESQYSNIQYNAFDLGHEHKTTFRFGKLYPVSITEALPGDKFKIDTTKMLRCLPMISPVMHQVKIHEHWFFVPNRLTWSGWEEYITLTDSDISPPVVKWFDTERQPVNLKPEQSIGAYFGLPLLGTPAEFLVNAMPLAAYALIYNEYYRDQNVMGEILVNLQDGLNTTGAGDTNINIDYAGAPLLKAWKRDYFTAALPTAQKGAPVLIPLAGNDPLEIILKQVGGVDEHNIVRKATDRTAGFTLSSLLGTAAGAGILRDQSNGQGNVVIDPNGQWLVDEANAATMNDFRTAMALQAFLEKDIVGGSRYTETIKAHYGAMPPDFRLQRPEYVGGNTQQIIMSEVLSTAETLTESSYSPVGQLAGHGISAAQSGTMYYRAQEHGYLICILVVEPVLNYINRGMHRMWTRQLREDYAWPTFAHLGEQAILNRELMATHEEPLSTFGYIPRYSEYKYHINYVTGEMANTLKFWHLAIDVPDDIALNSEFLLIDDFKWDLSRIFAVSNSDEPESIQDDYLVCQMYFEIIVDRCLPRFAVPKLVG